VLVVDASHAVRARLIASLREAGLEVVAEASTGAQAISLAIMPLALDAIVVDVLLPDRRGVDIVVALRAAAPRAVIAVVTNAPEYRHYCLARGADVFLDKSREFDRIAAVLMDAGPR
jgi:DNA-binding NarL/FixJ family response regulator